MIKHIFTAADLVFVTLIVFLGVRGGYKVISPESVTAPLQKSRTRIPANTAEEVRLPLTDYQNINKRNLFNTPRGDSVKSKAKVDLEGLKETALKLKLWGTIAGPAGSSYAVIEGGKDKIQNLYKEGDNIQDAKVKLILREKVVLTVNGRDEVLGMEEMKSSGRRLRRFSKAPFATRSRAQKITLRKSQIDSAMKNVGELMQQIRVRPHFKNGQPDGIRLSSIRPRSIFRRMGLRNGDIITGVDGRKIESVDDALKFYENIRSSTGMAVQIKRRGREKTIDYKIR